MPNAMTNIGGALCESSVIPFIVARLVACRKFWLSLAARAGIFLHPLRGVNTPYFLHTPPTNLIW